MRCHGFLLSKPVAIHLLSHTASRNTLWEARSVRERDFSYAVVSDLPLFSVLVDDMALVERVAWTSAKWAVARGRVWARVLVPPGGILNYSSRSRGRRLRNGLRRLLNIRGKYLGESGHSPDKFADRVLYPRFRLNSSGSGGRDCRELDASSLNDKESCCVGVCEFVTISGHDVGFNDGEAMENAGAKGVRQTLQVRSVALAAGEAVLAGKVGGDRKEASIEFSERVPVQVAKATGALNKSCEVVIGVAAGGAQIGVELSNFLLEQSEGSGLGATSRQAVDVLPGFTFDTSIAKGPFDSISLREFSP